MKERSLSVRFFPGFTRMLAFVLLLALLAGRANQAWPQSGELPKAEEILDRYIEVTGGKDAYEKIYNRVSKGTIELKGMGVKGSITLYQAKPNKSYTSFEFENLGSSEEGTNGDVAWELNFATGPRLLEGEEKAFSLRHSTFNAELYWRKLFKKAECAGVETIGEQACYKVVMTPPEGKPETWYFDKNSNLLVKVTITYKSPMGEIPLEIYSSDYKEVNGIRLPHTGTVKVMFQELILKTESIQHNTEIPGSRFDLPEAVKALVEKAKEVKKEGEDSGKLLEKEDKSLLTPEQRERNLESFDTIWKTVRERHWDPSLGGLDWDGIHKELRPKVENAKDMAEARSAMKEMLGRLEQSHFNVIPSDAYEEMDKEMGKSREAPREEGKGLGDGATGLDVRVLQGEAVVVSVEESAAALGIRPGWQILEVREEELEPVFERVGGIYKDSTVRDLILCSILKWKMTGKAGDKVNVAFLKDGDERVEMDIPLIRPEGTKYKLGHMPPMYVWIKWQRKDDNIGWIAFNTFADPVQVMRSFEEAIRSFMDCDGILIDIRGNPGGLGIMAMGMAGWFVEEKEEYLGTMHTRQTQLKFVVNPRLETYKGPVAILIDGCSASCSEIFSSGMKDIGRARLFGTRTAGAVLPSAFERLPNGDGFQYAFADYISKDGRRLEGTGVIPHEEVQLTQEALLEGRDPVEEAAIRWIKSQK